jgi:hypothetical protein
MNKVLFLRLTKVCNVKYTFYRKMKLKLYNPKQDGYTLKKKNIQNNILSKLNLSVYIKFK